LAQFLVQAVQLPQQFLYASNVNQSIDIDSRFV
jgi:hypothetical protein